MIRKNIRRAYFSAIRHFNDYYSTIIFRIKLTFNNISYGKNVRAYNGIPKLYIHPNSQSVNFGNNVRIRSCWDTGWYAHSFIEVQENAVLTIGNNVGINSSMIIATHKISIGNHVFIGGGTKIYDTNFHNLSWEARRDAKTSSISNTSPVIIEDDVFIGTDCIIGKGVTIGARSIIAAGSVVVKSIPNDCIAGGNPAKVIKTLINN